MLKKMLGVITGMALTSAASASLVFFDENGDSVSAPSLIDPNFEAVYFTETQTGFGGVYEVTNNTSDYFLSFFGISNSNTTANTGVANEDFDCGFDSNYNWCYSADNISEGDWATTALSFGLLGSITGGTFGTFDELFGTDDNTVNAFEAVDGELGPGSTDDMFGFQDNLAASSLFVVLSGNQNTLFGFGGQPLTPGGPTDPTGPGSDIPVPATLWLFGAALFAVRLRREKRTV